MHRSTIVCDRCKVEDDTKSGPFPDGWVHLAITVFHPTLVGGNKNTKTEKDLCPLCLAKINEALNG